MTADTARNQVWDAIRTVTDPELDESIADIGFIQSLALTRSAEDARPQDRFDVHIKFRLPTYWCAANFAFIMAEDILDRVNQLPWVGRIRVELADHFTADEINQGIAAGHSFSESFPAEASENLASLRRLFRIKAFQRRQYRLLTYLLGASHERAKLLSMTITQLSNLAIADAEGLKLRSDYLAILPEFFRPSGSFPAAQSYDESPAFILPNGKRLDPDDLDAHLRKLRRTTTNIEFNSALCSSLLKSRNKQ